MDVKKDKYVFINDASWVWLPEKKPLQNTYVVFRLVIKHLPISDNSDCCVNVSASNLYLLYVNGVYCGRGPVRSWKGHIGIDAYTIGKHLVPDKNVISAVVHYYGVDVGASQLTRSGFLLQGYTGGISLSTGVAPWQACRLTCWNSNSPRISLYAGFNEDVDMWQYNPGVWRNGSDDADWQEAEIIRDSQKHWPHKEKRMIPMLREMYLDPMKLTAVGEYDSFENGLPEWSRRMANERHRRICPERLQLKGSPWPIIILPGDPVYLIFDVGRMTSGVVEFEIKASGGEELRIGYADRLCIGEQPFCEKRAQLSINPVHNTGLTLNPDHGGVNNAVDRFILRRGLNQWRGLFNLRGFRYIKMSLSALKNGLEIRYVRVCEVTYPVQMRANFFSSDQQLNAIWQAGRLTTRLCMSDTFMDNPCRERQQYGGDAFMQALSAYYYFGDTKLWRQFLHLFPQGMRADKAIQSGGPWCWNQIIPAWTLLWIESIREYFYYTGDDSVLEEYADTVVDALEWFLQFEVEDGLLTIQEKWGWENAPGGVVWNFVDWQEEGDQIKGEEARLALNCLYYTALKTAAWIMSETGRKDKVILYHKQLLKVQRALKEVLSDKCCVDCKSEHVVSYASFSGLISGQMKKVSDKIFEKNFTTDMYPFFLLRALEKEGHDAAIITFIRDVLGSMLDDGTATFYETRNARYDFSRSLCQGVGGFCGYFLPRTVAGIKEILHEKKTVILRPYLDDIEWAEATVPCADGEIKVSVKNNFPGLDIEVNLPRGWRVKSDLPVRVV